MLERVKHHFHMDAVCVVRDPKNSTTTYVKTLAFLADEFC